MSVYFLQAGDGGRIKIGYAQIPRHRIAYLQRFSGPDLKTLAVIEGSRRLEYQLQQHCMAHHSHDEWFEPGPEVLAVVERAKGLHNINAGDGEKEDPWFTDDEVAELCAREGVIGQMAKEVRRFPYHYNNFVLVQLLRLLEPECAP